MSELGSPPYPILIAFYDVKIANLNLPLCEVCCMNVINETSLYRNLLLLLFL